MNMKKLKWKTLALALLVCVQAYSQTTLDQCVRMAYENYPQIKEKGLIDACQGYDLKNASLAWVPRLNISAKATWQSDVVEMPFDMPGFEFDIPHDQYGVTADLTQQIWDGGATAAKGRQIKAGAEVKRRQLEVNMYSIRSKVQSIYLGIILLDKQIELNNVLVSNLSRNQKEVQTLVDGGMAGPSDLDQIRVNILTCEQQQAALGKVNGSIQETIEGLSADAGSAYRAGHDGADPCRAGAGKQPGDGDQASGACPL